MVASILQLSRRCFPSPWSEIHFAAAVLSVRYKMDFHGKATSCISHWEIQFLGKETVHYEFVTDCDNKLCVTVRQAQLGKEGAERISRATKLGENRINEDINHYWHWQTA